MRERIVVSDTAVSISSEDALKEGINLIPLNIIWPDNSQDTDFTLSPEELYKKMEKKGIPTTSGATTGQFLEFYSGLYRKGVREICSVHLTSLKSITHGSAVSAAERLEVFPDLKIEVVDSFGVSLFQWFLVLEARRLINGNKPLLDIRREVTDMVSNCKLYAAFGTLDNLKKSGRVTGATAIFASVLDIMPVIQVEKGDLTILGKTRGVKKARRMMIDQIRRDIDSKKNLPDKFGIVYTRDSEVGQELLEGTSDIWKSSGVKLFGPLEAGSVLGVHAGPGAGGIAGFWRRE